MIVRSNPKAAGEILRLANEHKNHEHPRAAGLHASDLIYCRRKAWYRKRSEVEEVLDEDTLALFLMGQGHHAVFQRCIPEVEERLELPVATVTGTPDMDWPEHIDAPKGMPRNGLPPGEIKTTRVSSSKPILTSPHYIEQLATYCLTRHVNHGRLYVYHVNGAYNKGGTGMRPKMLVYDFEFADEELDAWREELNDRATQILDDEAPPAATLGTHYAWECGYCPYNVSKGGPCPAPKGLGVGFFVNDDAPAWVDGEV